MSDDGKAAKVAHVRRAGQTRNHTCHWPGCERQVPPAAWGCRAHWMALPKALRDKVWATYRVGQEESLTPSRAYLDVAQEVQDWIAEYEAARAARRAGAPAVAPTPVPGGGVWWSE